MVFGISWKTTCGIAAAASFFAPVAYGHGAPEYPISRQYSCYQNRAQPACQAAIAHGGEQAIYDWNGVNQGAAGGNHQAVVPSGQMCAGGQSKFKGFDLARADWQATTWAPSTDGSYEFRYHATAPHRTLDWKFYLTREGWKPGTAPLQWSDVELVSTLGANQVATPTPNRYLMKLRLPHRTGPHVLYAAWQRSDSQEAFYSCSDVNFGGGGITPPVAPSPLHHIGQVNATQNLPADASAKLRVFGRDGSDLEGHTLPITAANGARDTWLGQLATLVNGRSAYVRVGNLQGGSVTVPSQATVLQVYALTETSGVSYVVDIALPPTTPPVTPPGGSEWTEGAHYKTGQVVSYKGGNYVCLQGHQALVGAGWYPDAPSVINVLWKRQ